MSNSASQKKASAPRAGQRLGASLLALEKRYVFDAAIATELHSLTDTSTHIGDTHTTADATGHSFLAAAQALAINSASPTLATCGLGDHGVPGFGQASTASDLQSAYHALRDSSALSSVTGLPMTDQEAYSLAQLIAVHNSSTTHTQIAFVDSSLPDMKTLLADLPADVDVVMIDSTKDGVDQMAAALAGKSGITAVHVLSHGTAGNLFLGTSDLNVQSMSGTYAHDLATIKAALAPNADLLVYGCDFAKGTAGQGAALALAQMTGAHVAASTDVTGAASLGGNWTLEYSTGSIDVASIDASNWQHDLVTVQAIDGGGNGYVNQTITGVLTGQGSATNPVTSVTYALADINGNPLPLSTVVATAHGTVQITDANTGAYIFTPTAGYTGKDAFTFVVAAIDPNTLDVAYATAFENLVVATPALATQNDTAKAPYNRPVSGTVAGDVTQNPLNSPVVYTLGTLPAHGTIVFNADGTYTYTPTTGYSGADSFTWTASDKNGVETSSTSKVSITVSPPPLYTNYGVSDAQSPGSAVTISLPNGSYYSETAPGVGVTFSTDPANPPLHGSVSYDNVNHTFTYTANAGYTGTDSFAILVTDSAGYTTIVPVNKTVTSSGHSTPAAWGDTLNVTEGNSLNSINPSHGEITASGAAVTGNITYQGTPAHGTFTTNANGTYNYTPEPGPAGVGTFTVPYTFTDQFGQTASAVETIVVNPPPLSTAGVVKYAAIGASVSLNLDGQTSHSTSDPWVVGGSGVAKHLTYTITSQPLHGTMVPDPSNPNGGYTYVPNPGFSGVDSFSYDVFDGYHHVSATDSIVSPAHIFASPDVHQTAYNTSYIGTVGSLSGSPAGGGGWTLKSAPANGSVAFNADGSYTYTPNVNFHGLDKFGYKYTDSTGHTATNFVYIMVPSPQTTPDTPPTSITIPDQTNHDSTAPTVDVSTFFTNHQAGATLTYTAAGLPAGLSINPATGVISGAIDHLASQAVINGQYPVTIFVDDGDGGVTKQTFTWTIVNDPPVAQNHSYSANYFTPVSGNAALGDTDPNTGDVLTYTQTSNPAHGTVAFNSDGTYTYTPSATFAGTDTFTYSVSDGKGGTASATETITIKSPPIAAVNHNYTDAYTTPLAGNASTTDTYAPNSTFAPTSQPAHGTLSMNANGTYTYTPAYGFAGTDSFTYSVTDPTGQVATATEIITVSNPAIAALPHSYTTIANVAVHGNASTGDTDAPGSVFAPVSQPAHGTITFSANGGYTYTPASNYIGTDSFAYSVTDPTGQVKIATETITINKPPIAAINHSYNDAYTTPMSGNTATGDTYATGSTFAPISSPAHGTLSMNSNGSYTYTPAAGFAGVDTFNYQVTDPFGQTAIATETITVAKPPIAAVNHNYNDTYNTPLSGNAAVSDTYAPNSVFAPKTQPAHGTMTMNANGTYTYTPSATFAGVDTFTYSVTDPTGQVATAIETITIAAPPLVANNHSGTTPFNAAFSGNASTTDVYVAGSTFAPTSAPSHGNVVMNANGTYTYTPALNFAGTDSFSYSVTDPTGQVKIATETITVGKPPLLAQNQTSNTGYGVAVSGTPAPLDTYFTGSTFSPTSTPAHGSVVMQGNGSFIYTPAPGFTGTDTFTYKIVDPYGQTATATETVNVGPNAVGHVLSTPYLTPVAGNASTGDAYAPGSKFVAKTTPSHGSVSMNPNGTYTYSPVAGFSGTDSFSYTVTDPATGLISTATETITVKPPPLAAINHTYTSSYNAVMNGNAATGDTYLPGSTFLVGSKPSHGTVTMNANGTYTYKPTTGFVGTDTFTYTVTDASGHTAIATETITVQPLPVALQCLTTFGNVGTLLKK